MKSYYKFGANIHINDITMHGTFLDYCCVKSILARMLFWIDFKVDPRHYNEMLGYVLKVCGTAVANSDQTIPMILCNTCNFGPL